MDVVWQLGVAIGLTVGGFLMGRTAARWGARRVAVVTAVLAVPALVVGVPMVARPAPGLEGLGDVLVGVPVAAVGFVAAGIGIGALTRAREVEPGR